MSENRNLQVKLWSLEDIERELLSIYGEATNLPPSQTKDRIQGCADAALQTLQKAMGRE